MAGLPVNAAATPQEDPDTALVVFSGISLFQFYSGTLDSDLIRNQQGIEANIQIAPFANIPSTIEISFNNFLSSSNDLCGQIIGFDSCVSNIRILMSQSRFTEAAPLIQDAYSYISRGSANLDTIERATDIAATDFNVAGASNDSGLRASYTAVLERIKRLRDLLNLDLSFLTEQVSGALTPEQIANIFTPEQIANGITPEQILNAVATGQIPENQLVQILSKNSLLSTEITLRIAPEEAFVGDTISVQGKLSSGSNPLGNRQIEIMLNGSPYINLYTDPQGYYSGSLQVPYWYVPMIQIQYLYYPQAGDVGVYASALSTPVDLTVMYYSAVLSLKTEKNAYPGLKTAIAGQFDYGSSPVPDTRNIEVSLDNSTYDNSEVTIAFTDTILLPDNLRIGKHLVTISAPASGRYAPVIADATLNVTQVTPVLTVKLPSVTFIPGSFDIQGVLDSDLGPVAQARIIMTFDGKQVEAVSGDDGTFSATISNSWGLGLFGSQIMNFNIIPVEPWQTTLNTSHKIMAVYFINCIVFFLILLLLGIILPRRLKFRRRIREKKELTLEVPALQPEPASAVVASVVVESVPVIEKHENVTAHNRLFYWYRIVIQLVQTLSGRLLKPNQTLREFVRDTGQTTGLAGKFILEFTKMIEKVLYSKHQVTEDDAKSGERLAHQVQESLKK
jgi:hypothetical protein